VSTGSSASHVDAPQDLVLDEMGQARGEDVLRNPEVALEVSEPARAEERIAHDQERPPVPERLERLADAAVHVREAGPSHDSQSTR
jgi:hypothetical protein